MAKSKPKPKAKAKAKAKAKPKTVPTTASVREFLNTVPDEVKKKSCFDIADIFKKETGFEAKMWGPAIVGFGSYHYKYASGHEGDAPIIGFSPRKAAIVLYLSMGFEGSKELLGKFGKHKMSKACIYIQSLDQIDEKVLQEMVRRSVKHLRSIYPS